MTDRELLEWALEEMSFRVAYVYEHEGEESGDDYSNVCDAIRARLAQPEERSSDIEQEPVYAASQKGET